MRRPAVLGLIGLVLAAGCSSQPNVRFVAVTGRMPVVSGPTLMGDRLDPAAYAGKVVLVNFWATWCAPCRREQPGLEALWRRLGPRRHVLFIGVNHRDQASAARSWIARYGVTYPSLSDPNGDVAARFDVPFLPTTILVDGAGRLRYRLVGEQKPEFLEGMLEAVAALGSPAGSAPLETGGG